MRTDLTAEYVRSRLSYDPTTGDFTWAASTGRWAGQLAGSLKPPFFYRHIRVGEAFYLAHRLAWLHFYGTWPTSLIDHINGIRHDNRIANLREATPSQNQMNARVNINNTSGIPGVMWDKRDKVWRAKIRVNKDTKHLGSFKSKEDAIAARRAAEIEYFGDFRPRCAEAA